MVKLRIRELSFHYDTHPVFRDGSLDIRKGEVVSIIGRNGAGKSTFLRCINHILKPSCGHVYIDDKEMSRLPRIRRAKRCGYLSQRNQSLFSSTVFDVILAGRYPHSPFRFTRHDEEIVAQILADMELSSFSHRPFDHLSGGEQQQVLIARALAQGADILLLDEPTNNLDIKHQLQIMRLIRSIAEQRNITTLLAIHDLNLAAAFSDRIVMLHDNTIFTTGSPGDVMTSQNILKVFGIETKIYYHDGNPQIVIMP